MRQAGLFGLSDHLKRLSAYLAIGGKIVDATLISAPKQRNNQAEKEAIKKGKSAGAIWPDEPDKAA